MKKLIVLVALFITVYATNANAQQGGGDPAMRAKMKEMVKPQLIEKTKITDAEAEKVMEINFEARQQMRGFRDLSEDDRKKKMEVIQADLDKKYKEIPLTESQIKSVNEFYEEMRKNRQQGGGWNGGGNNKK
jgi:hypothetical protein